jgi:hypothetical protein
MDVVVDVRKEKQDVRVIEAPLNIERIPNFTLCGRLLSKSNHYSRVFYWRWGYTIIRLSWGSARVEHKHFPPRRYWEVASGNLSAPRPIDFGVYVKTCAFMPFIGAIPYSCDVYD